MRYQIIIPMVLTIATSFSPAQTADANKSRLISASGRPLEDAAVILQGQYGKPVTYEEPILIWPGDTDQVPYIRGGTGLVPKRRSFSMPPEANPENNPILDAGLLEKVVNAYNTQTDGPLFKVSASRWGLHIIPSQLRDVNGQFVESTPLLDTRITIPVEMRTPSAHFARLCEAVSNTTGFSLKPNGMWMDQYFSPKRLPRKLTEEHKKQISFLWGVSDEIARDAAISLLEHSASTMTWKLLCQSDEGFCVFNLQPVMVDVKGSDGKIWRRALQQDRQK